MANKGLKRLFFFVVFLIPVGWYLFLQIFGENKFSLEVIRTIPYDCLEVNEVTIFRTSDSVTVSQRNYLNRITYKTTSKKIPVQSDQDKLFDCLNIQNDLILADEEGVWGVYDLDREGVDQLLTELDILIIQKSYGKGVSR